MNISKQYLVELSYKTNFIRDNLEKVLRLSEILKFLNNDNIFKNKLALKGGTAINLTAVELPRLSVDIDLDFTEKEQEFIEEFKNRNYKPELLFESKEIINNIKLHPMALWRCKNK